jgi:hypothetical protein
MDNSPETTWHDLDVKNLSDKFYQRQQARRAAERKAEAYERMINAERCASCYPDDLEEQDYARRMRAAYEALQ